MKTVNKIIVTEWFVECPFCGIIIGPLCEDVRGVEVGCGNCNGDFVVEFDADVVFETCGNAGKH